LLLVTLLRVVMRGDGTGGLRREYITSREEKRRKGSVGALAAKQGW